MIAAIHQPNYLPSMRFFDKMHSCDVFVLLDDAQFTRNSFINRNRINTPNGPLWLTVPVLNNGRFGQLIRDTEIDNSQAWARKHYRSIKQNYPKANEQLEAIYSQKWDRLIDLNLALIFYLARCFSIFTRLTLSSTLEVSSTGTTWLVDICDKVEADTYLSGTGGRNYQDEEQFEKAGVKLLYQEGSGPSLSAIDNLLNPRYTEVEK